LWAVTGLFTLGLSFLPRKGRLGVWLAVGLVALILYRQPPAAAQPAQPSASASHSAESKVNMTAPDGSTKDVPADQVEYYKRQGATVTVKQSGSLNVFECAAASEAFIRSRRGDFTFRSQYDYATGLCYVSQIFTGTNYYDAMLYDVQSGKILAESNRYTPQQGNDGIYYGVVAPEGLSDSELSKLFYSDANKGRAAYLKAKAFIQNRMTPADKYKQTATNKKTGHRIGSNDGMKTWYDVQTGQRMQ
jgi:hypothetical protein